MRITDAMVVPEGTRDDDARIMRCAEDDSPMFFVPQKVGVFSRGGFRTMRLWTCEKHPLPDTVTDEEEG